MQGQCRKRGIKHNERGVLYRETLKGRWKVGVREGGGESETT